MSSRHVGAKEAAVFILELCFPVGGSMMVVVEKKAGEPTKQRSAGVKPG